jgi:hypothetical protein
VSPPSKLKQFEILSERTQILLDLHIIHSQTWATLGLWPSKSTTM